MSQGPVDAKVRPRTARRRAARPLLAVAIGLFTAWASLAPAGCTRTVCEDALDICGEPPVTELKCDDPSFVCTSQCIVDNDTCDEDLLESCLAQCR